MSSQTAFPRIAAAAAVLFFALRAAPAEAPLAVTAPLDLRGRIVAAASSYEGVAYEYGGTDRGGMDCSGLIYRVYSEVLDIKVPRTVRGLHDFCELIEREALQPGDIVFFDTTGPLAHAGIYIGDGRFVHAASEGLAKGVIVSSLEEPYYARNYAGAGRLLPAAEVAGMSTPPVKYGGLILCASLGPSIGAEIGLRGVSGSFSVFYPIAGLEVGLALRPEYDATLGVFRLPAVLCFALGRDLGVFFGPALTLGEAHKGGREYEPEGGLLATAGLIWTPVRFRAGGEDWRLYGEFVYNRYAESGGDGRADPAVALRAGFGLQIRTTF